MLPMSMKNKTFPNKSCILEVLKSREYGPKCPVLVSYSLLRLSMFSYGRKWAIVDQGKYSSAIEFNYDALWVPRYCKNKESLEICSRMTRIRTDGTHNDLFKLWCNSPVKDIVMFDLPDPLFKISMPLHEYRPTLCILRKNNVLSRHDMVNGKLYDSFFLGRNVFKSMSWNTALDQLDLSSSKLKNSAFGNYFVFKIFKLHPFKYFASFIIKDCSFPWKSDVTQYGKLQSAEIESSFLLVTTYKGYTLCYNLEELLKEIKSAAIIMGKGSTNEDDPYVIEKPPPILFATQAYLNLLSFGGHPWMYIRSVSNCLLEIHDLKTGDLIKGGSLTFEDLIDKVIPDHLTFHIDDSNRVIHFNNSKLRILRIKNKNGEPYLVQEFHYDGFNDSILQSKDPTVSVITKKGRSIKRRISDATLFMNRALAFGVENDLNVLFILESNQDLVNGVELSRITFYDINSYEILHQLHMGIIEDGDIETNNFMIFMDKDILIVVTKIGSIYRYISFRLTYQNMSSAEESSEFGPHHQCFGPLNQEINFDTHRNRSFRNFNRRYLRNRRRRMRGFDDSTESDEDWNP